ncbi:uncharacterized protein LOC9650120 isoform X2 [Selaginella moellendorffii]|uniref:uncharacterized protein LOC9650120 isoform X2 n=1 Tax=Selaginella moellendorffii TaxID=88036 RepID=UPI000D1CFB71|nr:uncharacterized protein LOC9650120 isoform X2 [Selaginella moellendorffii]|eukprot:XP_024529055.1 uncharacterized protein LOC9650120 isoform X2 [Selaginella moellendorffii]
MLARISQWVAKASGGRSVAWIVKLNGGKELIGRDDGGNTYFRKPFVNDLGVSTEKRWMEFAGDPDPTTVPVEWSRWLTYTRKDAPTPQELVDKALYRKNVKIKAALIQKEEEKRIFRAKSLKKEGVDMSPQTMERFLRQVSSQDEKSQDTSDWSPVDSSRAFRHRRHFCAREMATLN